MRTCNYLELKSNRCLVFDHMKKMAHLIFILQLVYNYYQALTYDPKVQVSPCFSQIWMQQQQLVLTFHNVSTNMPYYPCYQIIISNYYHQMRSSFSLLQYYSYQVTHSYTNYLMVHLSLFPNNLCLTLTQVLLNLYSLVIIYLLLNGFLELMLLTLVFINYYISFFWKNFASFQLKFTKQSLY